MERTPWERAMGIRRFKETFYQKKLLEHEKAQEEEKENMKSFSPFEKELEIIVSRVLELVTDFNINDIYIHINEKHRKFRSNVTKVSVTAEGKYTRNVYFHCSEEEACTLIKEAFEKNDIPYGETENFYGLTVTIK